MQVPSRPCSRWCCYTRAGLWVLDVGRMAGAAVWYERSGTASLAVTIRRAGAGDVAELCRVSGLPREQMAHRLAQGKRCYLAEVAGAVVSYGWISLDCEEIPELERSVRLGPGEAYIWDCFTVPAYRGRGLLPAILRAMVIDMRTRGIQRAWAVILAKNRASQRAFQRAGFTHAVDIRYLRLLAVRCLKISGKRATPAHLVAAAKRLFS